MLFKVIVLLLLPLAGLSLRAGRASVVSRVSRVCPVVSGSTGNELCTCGATAEGIYVSCTNLSSRAELSASLKFLEGYRLFKLGMVKVNLTVAPQDFETVKFLKMDVESSVLRLKGVDNTSTFDENNEDSLRVVQFKKSKIDLGTTTLAETTELKSLEFEECSFEGYKDGWFNHLTTDKLRIVNSPLVNQPIARGLVGLQEYQHTKCGLRNLTRSMLPEDVSVLRVLDFSQNKITKLSNDFLEGVNHVTKIDLSGNRLAKLSKEVFRNFEGELSASGNPLVCSSDLLWLRDRLVEGSLLQGDLITCSFKKSDTHQYLIPVIMMEDSLI